MQLGNSCHLFITEFELRVDRLVRSNPNGLYNMHFGLVSAVSLRQAHRGRRSRILWPCGRAVILSHHPNLVGVLANSSFPLVFSLLHLFFFPSVFSPLLPVDNCPPPSRHALLGSAGQLLLVTIVTVMTTLIICSYDKKV